MGVTVITEETSYSDFSGGTHTNTEADSGGFLRLKKLFADKDLYLPEVASASGLDVQAPKAFTAVNCTGLTKSNAYLQIELKCSDWSKRISGYCMLEITSYGNPDVEEWNYDVSSLNIKSTYQTFLLPLSSFTTNGGELVVNQVDFIRWYASFSTAQTIAWRNARIVGKYATPGNRVSPALAMDPVGTVKDGKISWVDRAGLHFNGLDSYAQATIPSTTTGELRFYARADGPMPAGGGNTTLVDIGNWEAGTGWGVWINTTDGNKIGIRDSKVTYSYSTVALSSITFKKIRAVYDGTDIDLYVDDVLVKTISNATVNAASTLTLGRRIDTTVEWLNGTIDELELLNLSGSRVAFYPLNDGTGTVLNDTVGTYDGTIYNAKWLENAFESRVSTDGGTTWSSWATCTNGGSISGLTSGSSASNLRVQTKASLNSVEPVVTPLIDSITVQVNAQPHTKNVAIGTSVLRGISASAYVLKGVYLKALHTSSLSEWYLRLAQLNVGCGTFLNLTEQYNKLVQVLLGCSISKFISGLWTKHPRPPDGVFTKKRG